jgi:phosphate uptake regulator
MSRAPNNNHRRPELGDLFFSFARAENPSDKLEHARRFANRLEQLEREVLQLLRTITRRVRTRGRKP